MIRKLLDIPILTAAIAEEILGRQECLLDGEKLERTAIIKAIEKPISDWLQAPLQVSAAFENELGRPIFIQLDHNAGKATVVIKGPDSVVTNEVTMREAAVLRNLLMKMVPIDFEAPEPMLGYVLEREHRATVNRLVNVLRAIESGKQAGSPESSSMSLSEWRGFARELQRMARAEVGKS